MKAGRSLRELFSFPGFVAAATLRGEFGDPKLRVVTLRRRKKRPSVRTAATAAAAGMTRGCAVRATCVWPAGTCMSSSSVGACTARDVAACT